MRETKKHTIIRLGSTKGDILSVINQHAPISRSKLAELFGLSFTAIAKIVNEFIEYGLVREVGKGHDTKLRGKKSNLLCINQKLLNYFNPLLRSIFSYPYKRGYNYFMKPCKN